MGFRSDGGPVRGCLVDTLAGSMVTDHDTRVRVQVDVKLFLVLETQGGQEIAHTFQAGSFLVVGLDDDPGAVGGMGLTEHQLLVLGIEIPVFLCLVIDRADFPLLELIHPEINYKSIRDH